MKQAIKDFDDLEMVLNQIEEIKKKLPINEDDLVIECVRQPVLHQEIGDIAANVKDFARRIEVKFENLQKDLSKGIRANPAKYFEKDSKITEAAINEAIQTSPEFRSSQEDLLDAQAVEGKVRVLVDHITSRKSMVGNLVDLKVSSYYTSGDMSKPKRTLLDARQEQIARRHSQKFEEKEEDEKVS